LKIYKTLATFGRRRFVFSEESISVLLDIFNKGLIFGRLRQILHRFSGSGSVLCRLAQSADPNLPKAKRKMSSSMQRNMF
jgi:hypothetical protein